MDISEIVLLAVMIPVDVLLLAIVIYGIVRFRKSVLELKKFINNQNNNHAVEADAALYACAIHPKVQGKKDEKCSKCGMKLTDPISEKTE